MSSSARQQWSFLPNKKHGDTADDKDDSGKSKTDGESSKLEAPDLKDVRMSRGVRPEMDVDFEKLRTLCVYDEHGNELRFMELFAKQKTIVIFIRHFLDFVAKEYAEDLALIPKQLLKEANVGLVVIGPSPYKFIQSFKTLTNYQHALYCDPERQVYRALGLHEKMAVGDLKNSRHVKSNPVMGVLRSVWRAMQSQEYQGNTKQQGGAFILGPGEQAHFCHQDTSSADHMNINDLLVEVGVQPVSFPKDQRVITI
ncbi:peroxiredoxin-like 2C [Babylonia areolata]|uniref:peroxiredoxin-like 2C n=1 Tax=Babylonia areolata TaxID=304850 RepID=UPI003FD4AC5F